MTCKMVPWFVEDNAVRIFHPGRVVAKDDKGGEELHDDPVGDGIDLLPYRVRDTIGAGGGEVGGLAQGVFDFIRNEEVGRGLSYQAASGGE